MSIDLLSTNTELDDLEKYIDIPILMNCEKDRIPEKIVFDTKGYKEITLYLYIYEGFEYEETINGVVIRITAESHILPQNTEVRISNVNQDDKSEKTLRNSIEGFKMDEAVAFDISFWSGNNEIKVENGTVNVPFTLQTPLQYLQGVPSHSLFLEMLHDNYLLLESHHHLRHTEYLYTKFGSGLKRE